MISMTTYWQQFKECVDTLPEPKENAEYSKQMNTAQSMIVVGLTIEKLGITEIKQVSNKLQELAKLYNNEVLFKAPEKEYRFNLPKIVDTNNLIFAINYYQHLSNYEQVSYQGSIGFLFKSFVTSSVNEKKIPTRSQSKAMLGEINQYCTSQNIEIDEALLLKKNNETAQEYTSRLLTMVPPVKSITPTEASDLPGDAERGTGVYTPGHEDSSTASTKQFASLVEFGSRSTETKKEKPPVIELNELEKLQQCMEDIKSKKSQVKIKIDEFSKKQSEYNQAKQKHQELNDEWQNQWPITRIFYQFISWFFEVPLLKSIKNSTEQLIKAESELNQQIPPNQTAESYSSDLILQVRKLNNDFNITEDQITQYNELKQAKQKPPEKIIEKELVVTKKPQTTPVRIKPVPQPSNMDPVYGFFKEHRQLVQATAVAAVAIAVQTLFY